MPCLIRDCDTDKCLLRSWAFLVGIDALFDKGRGKEGSWEDRKIGRWEKEERLEAGKIVRWEKEGLFEVGKLGSIDKSS